MAAVRFGGPRTHLRFGRYLAERGADALTRVDELNIGPYPNVDLGEPTHAVHATGHRDRWRDVVTSPLAEFR